MFSVQYKNWFIKLLLVVWVILIVLSVIVENSQAQELPLIIWIQAHNYDNGWGMECEKGCEYFNELGTQNELDMRFPDSWMVVNWYYYLFNRKYCATTNVCLQPLPEPMEPLKTLDN